MHDGSILVVDDCDTTRRLLSFMIREAGFDTVTATNGLDALEKLAKNNVALVLTDMNMPNMDGLELLRSIRSEALYGRIPVIVLSTEKGEKNRNECIEAGADMYLTKPIKSKDLIDYIKKLIPGGSNSRA